MKEVNDANVLKDDLILDFENKRVMVLCNYPGGPGKLQNFITFEAIEDLAKQIKEVSAKKDEKLKVGGFPTKVDIINYVKSMNTHLLIWVNAAWNQAEIIRRCIGKQKVDKNPMLEIGFNLLKSDIKAVVQLVDRMEENLNIERD